MKPSGRNALVAGAAAFAVLIGSAATPVALAGPALADASPTTLYVSGSFCSNTGPGIEDEPFCTVQEAANVANPGDTIIADGRSQTVVFTRSGTPQAPITVKFAGYGLRPQMEPSINSTAVPVVFDKVHDIKVSGLNVEAGNEDGIDVIGSQDITLDSNNISMDLGARTVSGTAGVSVDGVSSNITISRNLFTSYEALSVKVAPGASNVVITTNQMNLGEDGLPISVAGATGVDVTSNTILGYCTDAVDLSDGTQATVENNIITLTRLTTCTSTQTGLSVDASSAPTVTEDYNLFKPGSVGDAYTWAGTGYADAPTFNAATGQGTHDTVATPTNAIPSGESTQLDSANCSAPGELATDWQGNLHVQVPSVTDTGAGSCYADRGATEAEDSMSFATSESPTVKLSSGASVNAGTAPFTDALTVTPATTASIWNEPVTYTVDYGDGSPVATATPGTALTHTFTTSGRYMITVTATDTSGSTSVKTVGAYVLPATDPALALTAAPASSDGVLSADTIAFTPTPGIPYWAAASETVTGTAGTQINTDGLSAWYAYAGPGTYTGAVTQTDILGRTTTATATATVGDQITEDDPTTDYSGTVPAHGSVSLGTSTLDGAYVTETDAAVVEITASGAKAAGSIIAYPAGTKEPGDATVSFGAGQTVTNSEIVRGNATFANTSASPVHVTVVTSGLACDNYQSCSGYDPVAPARIFWDAHLAAGQHVRFQVAGNYGVPSNAQAAVLDVTEWGATAAGTLQASPLSDPFAYPDTPLAGATWVKGQQVTEQVVVPIGGNTILRNDSSGSAILGAYVVGYESHMTSATDGSFMPSNPARLASVIIAGLHSVKIQVAGVDGVPASATSVQVTISANGPSVSGTAVAYADGTTAPSGFYQLSYGTSGWYSGTVTVPVGKDGDIVLDNLGKAATRYVVDLDGSFFPAG